MYLYCEERSAASGFYNSRFSVYDGETGFLIASITPPYQTSNTVSVDQSWPVFNADGSFFYGTLYQSSQLRYAQFKTTDNAPSGLRTTENFAFGLGYPLALSADGSLLRGVLRSTASAPFLTAFDTATLTRQVTSPNRIDTGYSQFAVRSRFVCSPADNVLAFSFWAQKNGVGYVTGVRFYDTSDLTLLDTVEISSGSVVSIVNVLSFSSDGSRLYCTVQGIGTTYIDLSTNELASQSFSGTAFTADGDFAFGISLSKIVKTSLSTFQVVAESDYVPDVDLHVPCVLSPDNAILFVPAGGGIRAYDTTTLTLLWSKPQNEYPIAWMEAVETDFVQPAPTLTSVTPDTGDVDGGVPVTISGTNFAPGTSVTFDGVAATNVIVVSPSIITCLTPARSIGTVDVTIARPDSQTATLSAGFSYLNNKQHVYNILASGFGLDNNQNPIFETWKLLQAAASLPIPEAPGALGFDDYGGSFHTVVLPPLPLYATGLKLYRKAPGESSFTVLASGLAGDARLPVSGLEFDSRYDYYATATNATGESTPGPAAFIITNPSDSGAVIPSTPDAPTAVKNCAGGKIIVTDSVWNEDDEILRAGLRRRVNGGTPEILAPEWNAAGGTFEDENVQAFDSAEYSVNRIGAGGISAWSDWSTPVALQSETLELAWLLPGEEEATLTNKVTLRFSLDDSGETENDCGDPVVAGPCNSAAPEISLWLDGIELPAPTLVSGTPRHGEYSLLLDTRDYAGGARVLKVLARGTDCCFQKAERAVTLQNTLREGVLYTQVNYAFAPPAGMQYEQAELSLQNESLNPNPLRRYWTRHAIATTAPEIDFLDAEVLAEDKADAFDVLQQITMRRAQPGVTPERTQYFATPLLAPPGASVHWVQQWTPEQVLSFHTTGCGQVAKFRDIEDGETFVFARGGSAKVFSYESGVLTLLADLSTHSAADATDAALLDDKVFVVAPDELFAVDLDSGQATLNLAPRGEARAPRFVEKVGAAMIAVFVDENLSEERTRAYDMTFAAPRLLWSLDEAVTRVLPTDAGLIVACGAEYFSTAAIATAPTLQHTFAFDVAAMDGTRVKLQSGDVWRKDDADWIEEVAAGDEGTGAVASWEGAGEVLLGVAGGESAQLIEQLSNGQWIDGRTIAPGAGMVETIESIAALARYEKVITPASGTPGEPGYTPMKKVLALLIGTAPDGVLAVLELSTLSEERGALKASRVSHLNIDAYSAPVESE